MSEVTALDPARLVTAAVVGLVLLLVLIIKCKIHAMLSILLGAITIGMIAGMPFSEIVSAVNDGISNPYIIIGLGVKGYLFKRSVV